MDVEKVEKEYLKKEKKHVKGYSKAETSSYARMLMESVRWLHQPLVYFARTPDPEETNRGAGTFISLKTLIAERLQKLPPGIYALEIKQDFRLKTEGRETDSPPDNLNPQLLTVNRITRETAAEGARTISRLRKMKKALEKAGIDYQSLLHSLERRLGKISRLTEASENVENSILESMIIEEYCLWIGDNALRPSTLLDSSVLLEYLQTEPTDFSGGKRCAAFILGQRRFGGRTPEKYRQLYRFGSLFSKWPADEFFRIKYDEKLYRELQNLSSSIQSINSPETSSAALEFLFTGSQESFIDFLKSLPSLSRSLDNLKKEPERRYEILRTMFNRALFESHRKIENLRKKGPVTEEKENRVFQSSFIGFLFDELNEYLKKTGLPLFEKGRKKKSILPVLEWTAGIDTESCIPDNITSPDLNTDSPDVEKLLKKLFPILPENETAPVRRTLMGLIGRISGCAYSKDIIPNVCSYINACRTYCACQSFTAYLDFIVLTLERVVSPTNLEKEKTTEALSIPGRLGDLLLNWALKSGLTHSRKKHKFKPPTAKNLLYFLDRDFSLGLPGRLDYLDVEDFEFIIEKDLFALLADKEYCGPDTIIDFMEWAKYADEELLNLGIHFLSNRIDMFHLGGRGLVELNDRWYDHLVDEYELPPDTAKFHSYTICNFLKDDRRDTGRKDFLIYNFSLIPVLYSAFVEYIRNYDDGDEDPAITYSDYFTDRFEIFKILYLAEKMGYHDKETLFYKLIDYAMPSKLDSSFGIFCREPWRNFSIADQERFSVLILQLARGDDRALLNLLDYESPVWGIWSQSEEGVFFLRKFEKISDFISAAARRSEMVGRIFRLIKRIGLALRLQSAGYLKSAFVKWENPEQGIDENLNVGCLDGSFMELGKLEYYRKLSGKSQELPSSILKIINRKLILKRELETLEKRNRKNSLNESAVKRLEKLRLYLEKPELVDNWIRRDISARVKENVFREKFESLERITEEAIRQHVKKVFGVSALSAESPEWDNAVYMYYSIDSNKRVMRDLLKKIIAGEKNPVRNHPANRAFLTKMKKQGIDTETWTGSFTKFFRLNGKVFKIYLEKDPLKVLKMGSLFGTCLGVDSSFSYSAVANALEINKRVIYVEDSSKRIVARRLVMLHRGAVYGFRSYGAFREEKEEKDFWPDIVFDLYCRELAGEINAELPTYKDPDDFYKEKAALFTDWFDDGFIDYDFWLYSIDSDKILSEKTVHFFADSPEEALHVPTKEKNTGKALSAKMEKSFLDALTKENETDEALRGFILLEESGLALIKKALGKGLIEKNEMELIAAHRSKEKFADKIRELIKDL